VVSEQQLVRPPVFRSLCCGFEEMVSGTEVRTFFRAHPYAAWGKESAGVSTHYRCYLNTGWVCSGANSGDPLGVRCVVALNKKVSG